jgi:hypothetical protein
MSLLIDCGITNAIIMMIIDSVCRDIPISEMGDVLLHKRCGLNNHGPRTREIQTYVTLNHIEPFQYNNLNEINNGKCLNIMNLILLFK